MKNIKILYYILKCYIENKSEKYSFKEIKKLAYIEYLKSISSNEYPNILTDWYFSQTGRKLNLQSPITFEDKIQWLKLYGMTDLHKILVDKFEVRNWISQTIGNKYLIPLIGVYDNIKNINYNLFDNEFVIKCNHGSGFNIIIKNKSYINLSKVNKQINFWMKLNYAYCNGLELQYKDIIPKVIIEKYLSKIDKMLFDYRFYCFNGEPKYIFIDINSGTPEHRRNIYDLNWNKMPIKIMWPEIEEEITPPKCFEEMIDIVKVLCKQFIFVRVDLYEYNDHPLFGEMTFTPMGGIGMPDKINIEWGKMLKLQ